MTTKKGVGIPDSYKNDAKNKVDILWKVRIKDRTFLADNIPLHMSLRVFDDPSKETLSLIKQKIKEFNVQTPNPENLKFHTTIFHSKHNHRDYYMLKIDGVDRSYSEFFEFFKNGYGFSHDKFMAHITIDKAIYDSINKHGLKPNEIEFEGLTIEEGAGHTVHEFKKSEGRMSSNNGMQLTPNEISEIEDLGTMNNVPVKMLRTKGGYFIAVGRPKGKLREEALAAGSHPAIVKFTLEKQFPDFQPSMMKSESDPQPIVNQHSRFLSEDLIKSGYDIFSIQNPLTIEFHITKHKILVDKIISDIEDGNLIFKNAKILEPFLKSIAGAASEKAMNMGFGKIKIVKS